MTAKIIDGKAIAYQILKNIQHKVEKRVQKGYSRPGLAVVLVGKDPASLVYVKKKQAACKSCEINSYLHELPSNTSESELISQIETLNVDPAIHGILIQLPLPKHIRTPLILEKINPKKDIDGFHPTNFGLLAQGSPYLRPCTPYGVIRLLKYENIPLKGLHAVIIGTSNIVGKPMAFELLKANCTITLCHSNTRHLEQYVKQADLLVSAMGKTGVIQSNWIKKNAIVIDIGITRASNGDLQGDIEFSSARERASYITPVPGGVGPMTIAMLLENTLLAADAETNKHYLE